MGMTLEMAPTYLKARIAAGVDEALPNLAMPFLKCIGERAVDMKWHIRNADLILHKPYTVAAFDKTVQCALAYDELLPLLEQISVANEVTIFVAETQRSDAELNGQLIRGDYSAFKICIDLWDSSEWTFVSDSVSELACAAAVIRAHNELSYTEGKGG